MIPGSLVSLAPRNNDLSSVIARSASDEAIQCVAVLDRFALLAMTSKKASLPDRRFHEPRGSLKNSRNDLQ
jgi:hypothetical protein